MTGQNRHCQIELHISFAFHNGKPVVLVDQSNNGDPDCHPTTNTDLESNFERIANQ